MKQKKILFIIESLRSGGKERRLIELLKKLQLDSNYKCSLIILFDDIHYKEIFDFDIKIYNKLPSHKSLKIFIHLFQIIRSERPNIIHSFSSLASVLLLPIIIHFKIKFINAMIANSPNKFYHDLKNFFRGLITFPFSDIIITNSLAAVKSFKIPKYKSVVINNGFDIKRLKKINNYNLTKSSLGIRENYVIGMVASFSEKKDYSTYLKAASTILKKRDDVVFFCIGDGIKRKKYEKLYSQYKSKKIFFTGRINNVDEYVRLFDIGVLTSYTEGFPNSVMEYMAHKKPAIVTQGGGIKELVINNKTGYIIDNENYNELVSKISLILDNTILSKKLGIEGYKIIINNFSIDKMVSKTKKLYSNS